MNPFSFPAAAWIGPELRMRFLVFIFGTLGAIAMGLAGVAFVLSAEFMALLSEFFTQLGVNLSQIDLFTPGLFLVIGAALALLGSILALFRCGPQGGVLMLLSLVGPAILLPQTLVLTGLVGLMGLLSFLVRAPRPAPQAA